MSKKLVIIITSLFFIIPSLAFGEFKIGVSAPLTGEVAEYGAAVRNGFTLAAQESSTPEAIKFFYEDNKYASAASVSAFNNLTNINKVDLVFNWGETPLSAVASIAEQRKVPVMAMSFDSEPSVGKKYIMRSANNSAEHSKVLVEYLSKQGYKKIAIVAAEEPFFASMIEGLKQHLKDDQEIVEIYSVLPSEQDFKTISLKLKKLKVDAIGVFLFPGQVSSFYRQAAPAGITVPTFGTDIFQSRTEIKNAQGHMEGAVYAMIHVPEDFIDKYTKKYGNDIQIAFAYNSYVFAKNVFEIFSKEENKLSAEEIMRRLKSPPAGYEAPFKVVTTEDGGTFYSFPITMNRIEGPAAKQLS